MSNMIPRCNAFFLSPRGKIVPVLQGTHIRQIIFEPKTFGLNISDIKAEFEKTGEFLGHEGKARDAIVFPLFEKGWVRVRFEEFGTLIFQLSKFDSVRRNNIKNFLQLVCKGTVSPTLRSGIYFDVVVFEYDRAACPFLKSDSPESALKAIKESEKKK